MQLYMEVIDISIQKPKNRSKFRLKLGMLYYGIIRKLMWLKNNKIFAKHYELQALPYTVFKHRTILRRQLKDVDMWMQENKIINLKIAVDRLNNIVVKPGETLSYWKVIGRPSKAKGYVEGMILNNGTFKAGIGGGLCQLSNLIFWMSAHTPLDIVERHRHGYDVFPDSNRTIPFGSGATCFYPHGDLMIKNNTNDIYQLVLKVGKEYLEGEWRVTKKPVNSYEVVERNHIMQLEYWGGYSRHNELYKQEFDMYNNLLNEEPLVENSAIMMYAPFVTSGQAN